MKSNLIIAFLAILITGCASTNAVKNTEKSINGNWSLSSITYDGNGSFNSTLFQDSDTSCFMDSSWYFISNNNRGTYKLNDTCSTIQRKFIWTIPGDKSATAGELLLKITDEDYKSASNDGYKLKITSLTEYTMTLTIETFVDGQKVDVNLNFNKSILV